MKRIAPGARVAIVPNGVDTEEFQPDGTRGTGVVFVGGTNWFPNRDALDFFCEQILPHVQAGGAHVPARWGGSASSWQRRRSRERYGVGVDGYGLHAKASRRQR